MQCCGKSLKWDHISQLYKRNTGTIISTPGLSIVHKLKYEHIYFENEGGSSCSGIICVIYTPFLSQLSTSGKKQRDDLWENPIQQEHPLYAHWFAINLYNWHLSAVL